MKLTNLCIAYMLTGGILYHVPLRALLKGVTEAVEKTTAGAAHAVERITETIIPPAEKIVAAPLKVTQKTTSAVADVFRVPTLEIINDAKQNLTVELLCPRRRVYSITSINSGDRAIVEKPHIVRFIYGELTTEVGFVRKLAQGPVIMNVTVDNGAIRTKQTRSRNTQKSPKPRKSARKIKTEK